MRIPRAFPALALGVLTGCSSSTTSESGLPGTPSCDPDFKLGTNGKLHLTWPSAVADGVVTDATGTFVTASVATFCARSGTKVLLTRTDGVTSGTFVLTGLMGSPSCKGAVAGTITGCFRFPTRS